MLGLVSGALHLAMVGTAPTPHALVMLALAAVCLTCSLGLWRAPTRRTWATVAVVNAAMLLVHVAASSGVGQGHGGHHGVTAVPMAWAGAVAAAEVLLALVVLAVAAPGRPAANRAQGVDLAQ